MSEPLEPSVVVRRQWNNYDRALVNVSSVHGLHWSDISGGIGTRAPRDFLMGYIFCTAVLSGGLSHSCRHGPPPHNIKVCIVKKDNPRETYDRLLELMKRGTHSEEFLQKVRRQLPEPFRHAFNQEIRDMFSTSLSVDEAAASVLERAQGAKVG